MASRTQPVKELEVVEGSRAATVHKVLTDAGRPISFHELQDGFLKTELGKKTPPGEKPWYSGIQALKKQGHCVRYKGYITTPDILKKFQADVAAGLVTDIDELSRFNSRWRDAIIKFMNERDDWIGSRDIADHLSTLQAFTRVKDTHTRTSCFLAL